MKLSIVLGLGHLGIRALETNIPQSVPILAPENANNSEYYRNPVLEKRMVVRDIEDEAKRATEIIARHTQSDYKEHRFIFRFLKRKLIPVEPFKECKGIAIVTLGRIGKRWISGNLGSGLVLRKFGPGSWSAPSALRVVGVGSGVQIGLEITDYVVFLNSDEAVQLFYQAQFKLSGRASLSVVDGYTKDIELAPINLWAFSRGLFVGATIELSMVWQRLEANEKFYGKKLEAKEILSGNITQPAAAAGLYQALRLAEGLK